MTPMMHNLLTASFYGSVIILAVLLLRLILKKAPKRVVCVLWMLAFIRLLMPFQLESKLSLQPEVVPLEETTFYETVIQPNTEEEYLAADALPIIDPALTQPDISEGFDENNADEDMINITVPPAEESASVHWTGMLPYFWLIGAITFFLYAMVSYIQLKRTVREAIKIIGCWECDRIETAFILGYIRPRIYVPMGLSRRTRKHILAHEWAHLQTGDHWFKLLAYLACCLHWFNPLVWVAYRLMCKDMEHACDERVVRYMNLEDRKLYSRALLTCSTNHSHYTPCPVAFGEVSVKSRILSVLNYRKPGFWITLIAVIAVICVGVFLMTSPVEEEPLDDSEELRETIAALEEQVREQELLKKVEYKPAKRPTPKQTVTVSTVNEFLAAIAPDTEIILNPGTYKLSAAAQHDDAEHEYYRWNIVGDGKELELYNVNNLVIRGSGKDRTTFLVEPRMAAVLSLSACNQVLLEGFTAGHTTTPQHCSGGVIDLENCTNISADSLGLYGCGTIGLTAQSCSNVDIANSDIYDCSDMGLNVVYTDSFSAENCRIYRIGTRALDGTGMSTLRIYESNAVNINNCVISDSYVTNLVEGGPGDGIVISNTLFENNNTFSTALATYQNELVLDNVDVKNNRVGNWFNTQYLYAKDADGNHITEEMLAEANKSDEPTPPQKRVEVSTVDELLAAIAPNTEIILSEGNYDLSTAKGYGVTQTDHYYWYQKFDGPELVITNTDNLTIRGSRQDKTTITAIPRYANVLCFNSCSDITVAELTAGHEKEGGLCSGGVLEFRSANHISVDRCGLYGCGIYGVMAYSVDTIAITDSEIYECSQGGVEMSSTNNITIKDCVFRDLGGLAFKFYDCHNLINENNVLPEIEAPAPTPAITTLGLSYGGNGEKELTGHLDEFTIAVGQDVNLSLFYYPIDISATSNDVKWSSSDNGVITIDGDNSTCTIKGIGVGTATAAVELFGMKTSITVHVRESW